ncbi:hypothetical protein [Anabaena catenula]|uniref:Metal-dependent HD superfamily phosphohydrolase n=1 Tax=Anabaena catenula FACHB-362 TaxID=2692877 RepID=A0ABR8J912_9NOST|nr:hypothetical protein [Anabaena catenula]MBD2693972.1 hypothetical protein [Anabaena catenula FACHB-362]
MLTENLTLILFSHWQQTVQPFGVNYLAADQAFNHLVTAYSSPNRYYHTLEHIYHVLNTIDTLQIYAQDLPSVQLAAWFHDVVYDAQAQDNEEKSADYAEQMLTNLGIVASKITKVKSLILNTKNHKADNLDSQVLIDADLGILAAEPVNYQKYAQAIRQEYAWVSEVDYITGRQQVLERFLQRQRIYFTPLMLEVAEASARLNIQVKIDTLIKTTGSSFQLT